MDTTKTPRPTKPSNLFSTFLLTLYLWQFQLCPLRQSRVGDVPERFAASMSCEGYMRHVPEGGGKKFGQDTEGVTASVDYNG